MGEAQININQQIIAIKDQLGTDGHLFENVATLIASQTAVARDLYADPMEALLAITDALAGIHNKVPQEVVHRLGVFRQILGDNGAIADAASKAALCSSSNERKQLKEAEGSGDMAILREKALKLTVFENGRDSISLGEKIKKIRQ